jgi:hypothetical protein
MKHVTLQFPSILELVDFSLIIAEKDCEVKRTKLVLQCKLHEADIQLALREFKAILLN